MDRKGKKCSEAKRVKRRKNNVLSSGTIGKFQKPSETDQQMKVFKKAKIVHLLTIWLTILWPKIHLLPYPVPISELFWQQSHQWKTKIMMWMTKIHFLPLSALRSSYKVSTGTYAQSYTGGREELIKYVVCGDLYVQQLYHDVGFNKNVNYYTYQNLKNLWFEANVYLQYCAKWTKANFGEQIANFRFSWKRG